MYSSCTATETAFALAIPHMATLIATSVIVVATSYVFRSRTTAVTNAATEELCLYFSGKKWPLNTKLPCGEYIGGFNATIKRHWLVRS